VGYGEGALLAAVEQMGWVCYGVEIAAPALDYGLRRGWVVTSEPANDPRFVSQGFDVVSVVEVLEHISQPKNLLRDAASWLRPGGLLYITTPNVRSLNHRLLGLAWSIVSPPEHLVLWTEAALRRALEATGFQPIRLRTEGCNPSEMLAWLRSKWAVSAPVDRNKSALALSEAFSRSRFRRALKHS
jgi:SAM-dependent methyltransferase